MSNMLLSTVFCMILGTAFASKVSWNPSAQIFAKFSDDINGSNSPSDHVYAAPELLDDHKLAIAITFSKNHDEVISSVQLIGENNTKHECILPPWNININIRRSSSKTVLISAIESTSSKPWKLYLLNTETCKTSIIYKFHRFLWNSLTIITSNNSSDERFMIVMQGPIACRGYDWCRLHFDPYFVKFEPLNFDISPHSLRDPLQLEPATTFDSHLFITQFRDENYTKIVRLYDLSTNRTGPLYRELFTVPFSRNKEYSQLVSSGLSFCWFWTLDHNSDRIHCLRFREDGSLMFNRTIVYTDAARKYHVQTIPNGLIVISKEYGCPPDPILLGKCKIEVAVITSKFESTDCDGCSSNSKLVGDELIQIKRRWYATLCNNIYGQIFTVRANKSNDSLEVQYLCDSLDDSVYGAFYID